MKLFLGVLLGALLMAGCSKYSDEHVWYRSIGGIANNSLHLTWGTAHMVLARKAKSAYADGISTPSGMNRPSAREVSNRLFVQNGDVLDERGISDWVWQWGQFLDHDISLTEPLALYPVAMDIAVPRGDSVFDPLGVGGKLIPFVRSVFLGTTGQSVANPREQINEVTSFIDGSQVYGSDTIRDETLRKAGTAYLISSDDTNQDGEYLLPRNVFKASNCNYGSPAPENLFLSGDIRTNEVPGLIALHTIFMREHNRVVREFVGRFPKAASDTVFQYARKWLGAEMQVITYTEFLPALLGEMAPGLEGRYDTGLNPSISNEFTAALFRFGHSMIPPAFQRVDKENRLLDPIGLAEAFFDPKWVKRSGDLDPLVRGLASQVSQRIDLKVVEGLRSFLFVKTLPLGLDLAALNIQRGRDHGMPDYNSLREAYDLPRVKDFSEITKDIDVQTNLRDLFKSVDDIDAWVGALAEDHLPGASVGPLMARGLIDTFTRLRDGDRFWFEWDPLLTSSEIAELKSTKLSTIVRRNTGATDLADDLFHVQ